MALIYDLNEFAVDSLQYAREHIDMIGRPVGSCNRPQLLQMANLLELMWTRTKLMSYGNPVCGKSESFTCICDARSVSTASFIASRLSDVYDRLRETTKAMVTMTELINLLMPVEQTYPAVQTTACLKLVGLCDKYGMGADMYVKELLEYACKVSFKHGVAKGDEERLLYCLVLLNQGIWIERTVGALQSVQSYEVAFETALVYRVSHKLQPFTVLVQKLAALYHQAGAFGLAEAKYEYLCTQLLPDTPAVSYQRALNLIHKNDYEKAITVLRRTLSMPLARVNPLITVMAEFFIGQLLFDLKREEESMQWYRSALVKGLSGVYAVYALGNLASIYAKRTDFTEASHLLQSAVKRCDSLPASFQYIQTALQNDLTRVSSGSSIQAFHGVIQTTFGCAQRS
jgi:hypothetical protein